MQVSKKWGIVQRHKHWHFYLFALEILRPLQINDSILKAVPSDLKLATHHRLQRRNQTSCQTLRLPNIVSAAAVKFLLFVSTTSKRKLDTTRATFLWMLQTIVCREKKWTRTLLTSCRVKCSSQVHVRIIRSHIDTLPGVLFTGAPTLGCSLEGKNLTALL